MNYAEICIIKRDGKREDFSISKIKNAISKAFSATGIQDEQQLIADITMNVISQFATPTITVEEIQDLVEKALMKVRPEVAKKYIIYREWRNTERDKKTQMKHVMDGIVAIDKNDVNLSNANMSSHTPAGQMMTFASEVTKDYTYKYLLPKRFAEAHQLGDIHIHDLDYYPTKTTTCIQYDMDDLFERGFRTKNGSIRTPQSIQSYATLATIIFQTNQKDISIKCVLNPSNSSNQVTKLDRRHRIRSVFVIGNEQIICRKIYAFQQGTCTKNGMNTAIAFAKEFLYTQSDTCRKITDMISDSFFNCTRKIIVLMHLFPYFIRKGNQIRIIQRLELLSIFSCKFYDLCLCIAVYQIFLSFTQFGKEGLKISVWFKRMNCMQFFRKPVIVSQCSLL